MPGSSMSAISHVKKLEHHQIEKGFVTWEVQCMTLDAFVKVRPYVYIGFLVGDPALFWRLLCNFGPREIASCTRVRIPLCYAILHLYLCVPLLFL